MAKTGELSTHRQPPPSTRTRSRRKGSVTQVRDGGGGGGGTRADGLRAQSLLDMSSG